MSVIFMRRSVAFFMQRALGSATASGDQRWHEVAYVPDSTRCSVKSILFLSQRLSLSPSHLPVALMA